MIKFENSFWKRVDKSAGRNKCWPWIHASSTRGYGRVWFEGRTVQAHRVAYMLHTGKRVPNTLLVCHRCDSRLCCNPKHLFVGTCRDNTHDMLKKRRNSNGCSTKLTKDEVLEIRRGYANGRSVPMLAIKHGVAEPTIYDLLAWITWKHI